MKLLVIGRNSQIGLGMAQWLQGHSLDAECQSVEWSAETADAAEQAINELMINEAPDFVICAFTETELPPSGRPAYFTLMRNLAMQCATQSTALIYVSDSQVFDGIKNSPYIEVDALAPLSEYGKWQIGIERELQQYLTRLIILRAGWVFSPWSDNFLTRLLKKAVDVEALHFDPTVRSCPTCAEDISRVIVAIVQQLMCGSNAWGIYHYSSADKVSGYQFAEAVIAVASQYDRRLAEDNVQLLEKPCYQDDDLIIAPVVFSCKKILNAFGIKQLPWRASLSDIIARYYRAQS